MLTAIFVIFGILLIWFGVLCAIGNNPPTATTARNRMKPNSVPAWLWARVLKIDIAFEDVTVVQLIGRPGDGKSVLLATLTEYLSNRTNEDVPGKVSLVEASRSLTEVLGDLKKRTWSPKTAVADPGQPAEYLIVKVDNRLVAIVAQPGDILRVDGAINPQAARQLFGPNDQLGVVFNAFRYDSAIATKALLGLIATLQTPTLDHDIARATLIACQLLFGMDEKAVQEQDLEWKEISNADGARVQWNPATAGVEGSFSVAGAAGDDPSRLLRSIRALATYAAKQDLDLTNMRELIRQCPGVVVVLSRLDLLPMIPSVGDADFSRIFDQAFGSTMDHMASQRVLARNICLRIEPDADRSVRIAGIDTSGGKNLWGSIARMLERRRIPRTGVVDALPMKMTTPQACYLMLLGAILLTLVVVPGCR